MERRLDNADPRGSQPLPKRLAPFRIAIADQEAVALKRAVASRLSGVEPFSATAFSAVATLLLFVGLVACYVPARHATRIDAMDAPRYA